MKLEELTSAAKCEGVREYIDEFDVKRLLALLQKAYPGDSDGFETAKKELEEILEMLWIQAFEMGRMVDADQGEWGVI